MTKMEKRVMLLLMDGWQDSSHNADTYLQVARELPNFEQRLEYWQSNPAVQVLTDDRLQGVRDLVEVMTGRRLGNLESLLDAAIERAAKRPN